MAAERINVGQKKGGGGGVRSKNERPNSTTTNRFKKRKGVSTNSPSKDGKGRHDGGGGNKRKKVATTTTTTAVAASASALNKKRGLKHERQSRRKHADVVVDAKAIWNKLRLKSNTGEEIATLTNELMSLLKGRVAEIAMQHDASRVVQAAVQFGTDEQRAEIVNELMRKQDVGGGKGGAGANAISELAKVQYAHFVILKIIKYCCRDEACVRAVTKSFKGQMAKLAVHSVGARVVELLFSTFPPKTTSHLKLELYGPQFALFSDGDFSVASIAAAAASKSSSSSSSSLATTNTSNHPTLRSLLENQPESRRLSALEHVSNLVNKGIEKGLFGFAYFQDLACQYMTCADPNDKRVLASSLAEHSIHLLSTREGSRLVAECAAFGTQKDRKKIVRSLKGYTRSSLLHKDAYLALLRLIDVTDDTVLVTKSVLAELQVNPTEKVYEGNTRDGGEDDGAGYAAATKSDGDDDNNDDDDDDDDGGNKIGKDNEEAAADEEQEDNEKGVAQIEGSTEEKPPSPILDLATSDTGSKLFLLLLSENESVRRRYFDPYEMEILRPGVTVTENGEDVLTSKKDPSIRREELLRCMEQLLTELCVRHADVLLTSIPGSRVMREYFRTYPSQDVAMSIVEACSKSMPQISDDDNDANVDVGEKKDGEEYDVEEDSEHFSLFEHPVAHLALKHMILDEAERVDDDANFEVEGGGEGGGTVLSKLLPKEFKGRLMRIALSNRGAFVVNALAKVRCIREDVIAELKLHRDELSKRSTEGAGGEGKGNKKKVQAMAGFEALLKLIE